MRLSQNAARSGGCRPRRPFLHPGGYGFPGCPKRRLGSASRSASCARRSPRGTACRGDRSAHLRCQQAGCSCRHSPGSGPSPGSRVGSSARARARGCIRNSRPGSGNPGPRAQSAAQLRAQSGRSLPSPWPLLFQNLRQVGKGLQSTVEGFCFTQSSEK
jgi:hypothetical protein